MEAEYANRIVDTCAVGKKRPRWRELIASRRGRYCSFLDELPDDPRNFEPASLNELDADERSVDAEVAEGIRREARQWSVGVARCCGRTSGRGGARAEGRR